LLFLIELYANRDIRLFFHGVYYIQLFRLRENELLCEAPFFMINHVLEFQNEIEKDNNHRNKTDTASRNRLVSVFAVDVESYRCSKLILISHIITHSLAHFWKFISATWAGFSSLLGLCSWTSCHWINKKIIDQIPSALKKHIFS